MSRCICLVFATFWAFVAAAQTLASNESFVAHEWGTFTSVAGANGAAVQWAPLFGAPDLPCFVNRLSPHNFKAAPGLMRMETPVLYFYSPRSMKLSVHVDFPQGWITEWYPKATDVRPETKHDFEYTLPFTQGQIQWDGVELSPGTDVNLPSGHNATRYYAARNTESSVLSIGEQHEKFIFYRGIATFAAPIEPQFTSAEKIEIRNTGGAMIPLAIVFENREGTVGYEIARNIRASVTLSAPQPTGTLEDLPQVFADALVASGLYEKEAQAMIETWHDSWFEQGMRVFYIVPRGFVDSELPLKITPAPTEVARVFVGRVEVLSPSTQHSIESALSTGDRATLARFGRFLDPFIEQIRTNNRALVESPTAREYLDQAHIEMWRDFNARSCVE